MKAIIFKPAGCQEDKGKTSHGWSCAAATKRARKQRHVATLPSRERQQPYGPWEGETVSLFFGCHPDSVPGPRRGVESGLAAHRQTPALLTGAGSQPLGSALVSGQGGRGGGLAPRPAPPLHREGTPPGQRRPPVPRPEPAEGRGPAAAADGRAGRRPRGNTAGRREEREAAGPGPRGQPGPARQPPLRAHLTLSDNPRPDLPPGRLTQPRPVPTERRQPRSRPPLPAPGRPRLSSPLFSLLVSSPHGARRRSRRPGPEVTSPSNKSREPRMRARAGAGG